MEKGKITIERIPLAELEENLLTSEYRCTHPENTPQCLRKINEERMERLITWVAFAKANHKDYIYKCNGRILNYAYGDIIFSELKRMEETE